MTKVLLHNENENSLLKPRKHFPCRSRRFDLAGYDGKPLTPKTSQGVCNIYVYDRSRKSRELKKVGVPDQNQELQALLLELGI